MRVQLSINGEKHEADVEPRLLLVHLIRDVLRLDGDAHRVRHHALRRVAPCCGGPSREACTMFCCAGQRQEPHDRGRLEQNGQAASAAGKASWPSTACMCGYCTRAC